jgi:chromate reductase
MPQSRPVAVLVGSLRKESISRKVALLLAAIAPPSLSLQIVEIGDLNLYNQDLEDASPQPPAWLTFRDRMRTVQAVLFVTPEYNRSVPGLLKNAIDVGSRPYAHSIWRGKPCGVVSVSPGPYGAFGANHHIRQSFVSLDMPTLQQPEAYIAGAGTLFDADGRLTNEKTRELLERYMTTFAAWVDRHVT